MEHGTRQSGHKTKSDSLAPRSASIDGLDIGSNTQEHKKLLDDAKEANAKLEVSLKSKVGWPS